MTTTVGALAPTQAQTQDFRSSFEVSSILAERKREVTFGFAGDSIANYWASTLGDSPLRWAAWEQYPCNIRRIFNSAVGGTSSSHLLSVQIGQLVALGTKPDVVVVQSLQNDSMANTTAADGFLANVTSYVTQALAAGVKQVWVCSRPPKGESATGIPYAITYINRKLREFCRTTPGCVYIDVFNLWRDVSLANASTQITFKGTPSSANSFSDDGVHPTPLAMRAVSLVVADLLRGIATPISPIEATLEVYHNSTGIWNNYLGPNGLMVGTSGQLNGSNNTGVAGTAAADSTRWQITTANGVTVTPTLVTGTDGFTYQQLVLGGTASANTNITVSIAPAFNIVSGTFIREAIVEVENIVGVRHIDFTSGLGVGGTGTGSAVTTQSEMPSGLTSRFHLRSDPFTWEVTNFAGSTHTFSISIRNGVSPTGTVRFGRCGTFRIA